LTKYALKAIFLPNEGGEAKYTFYPEVTFDTEQEAINAINGDYGDELAQSASLDTEIDQDLNNYYFDDLDVYRIGE